MQGNSTDLFGNRKVCRRWKHSTTPVFAFRRIKLAVTTMIF